MHENNFEKQVQEKMDQLGFDPSDRVWVAVDKEINKEKKRRKPFFILFFFSGLVLAGGGIYFGTIKNSPGNIVAGQQQKQKRENQDKQSATKIQNSRLQVTGLNGKTINENDQKATKNLKSKQSREPVIIKSTKENSRPINTKDIDKGNNKKPEKNIIVLRIDKDNIEETNQTRGKTETEKSGYYNTDSSIKKSMTVAENKKAKDSVAALKTASLEKKKTKSSLWKIGFNGGTGISNLNQNLFKQSNVTGLYYNPTSVNGGSGVPAPAPVPLSSEINPGFSFSVGVFVNRYLSKRISISAGLNYHYYSTHINTGYPVDSSIIVYNPAYYWGNSTVPQAYAINRYYQNGNSHSYTNQYHFIELPVTADFQLNKSLKLPLFWEAGISVSFLLSSNALNFDPNGNLYYQNAQLFNKLQLNGATAIMIGFPINNNELRLGPQLQYGLSGLLKAGSGNPQHLLYTGLKISFIPGKK
ncbi:MAG TPA: porin family protein [Puia sp.]|nr:porin family protein [Puia sp.]